MTLNNKCKLEKPYLIQLQIEVALLDDIIWNLEHKENFVFPEKVTDLGYIKKLHSLKKQLLEALN